VSQGKRKINYSKTISDFNTFEDHYTIEEKMARHDCICPETSPCKDKATRKEMERNKECPHTTPPIEREDFEHGRMRPLSYSPAEGKQFSSKTKVYF
jgi:hypothetical protein